MSLTTYHFGASLRRGLTASLKQPAAGERAAIQMRVRVEGRQKGSEAVDFQDIDRAVHLYGPGDVLGFDPGIVTRTEPRAGVSEFEDNYFPAIEFAHADFPWRFTAAAADAGGRLAPWLSLVVLHSGEGDEEFIPGPPSKRGLPEAIWVLDPQASLPDLSSLARWAHVQATSGELNRTAQQLAFDAVATPGALLSRLVCPRRLRPATAYTALVVPTFELGRCGGLGIPAAAGVGANVFSWVKDAIPDGPLALPVYYRWSFHTAASSGDFESLVRQLQPRPDIEGVGQRPMDCSSPGLGMPVVAPVVLGLEGALKRPDVVSDAGAIVSTPYTRWGRDAADVGDVVTPFREKLAELLNTENVDYRAPPGIVVGDIANAPPIRDVAVARQPNLTTVRVTWTTDDARTSVLELNSPVEGLRVEAVEGVRTAHVVVVALAPGRRYGFRVAGLTAGGIRAQSAEGDITLPPLPSVLPPVYGGRHVAQAKVSAAAEAGWVDELNLDPRHRAAAGQGAEVVRREQEPLMASAWEQLGEIDRANELLRRAQLGREGSQRLWERFGQLGTDALLQATAPVHSRVVTAAEGGKNPVGRQIETLTNLPRGALTAAFRRITRPRGRVRKRQGQWKRSVISELMLGTIEPAGPAPRPAGMADICLISEAVEKLFGGGGDGGGVSGTPVGPTGGASTVAPGSVSAPPVGGVSTDTSVTGGNGKPVLHFCGRNFVCDDLGDEVAMGRLDALMPRREATAVKRAVCDALDWLNLDTAAHPALKVVSDDWPEKLSEAVLEALHPKITIVRRVWSRLKVGPGVEPQGDPLDSIMWAPEFPQPMYEPLRDVSKDFILPGLKHVPPDTIILLQTNRRFLESYMVGLNHEMAGELLWRGFPTDQRGSCFRQFFDVRDRVPSKAELDLTEEGRKEAFLDISKINAWTDGRLGKHPPGGAAADAMCLLLRGEIIRRYPGTVIYAVKAIPKHWNPPIEDDEFVPALPEYLEQPDPDEPEELAAFSEYLKPHEKKFPIFTGELPPDVNFFGFPFNPDTARDYYFVLEERVSEPRFGLDLPGSGQPVALKTWSDLAWNHLAVVNGPSDDWYLDALVPTAPAGSTLNRGAWTANGNPTAALIARATLQLPVRIAIPGRMMLPPVKG